MVNLSIKVLIKIGNISSKKLLYKNYNRFCVVIGFDSDISFCIKYRK